MGKARRGAILRRHERQQEHLATADFTPDTHARKHTLHLPRVADGDRQTLVKRLLGVEHDHRRHDLGYRGDGHHQVGVTRIQDLIAFEIDQQCAAGGELLNDRCSRGGHGWGQYETAAREQQTENGLAKLQDEHR